MDIETILYDWSDEKNDFLKNNRNISFEDVILAINNGFLLDIIKNQSSNHIGQYCFIIGIDNYAYVVPFIKNGNIIFLKTAFPDRRYTKIYFDKNKNMQNYTKEEIEIIRDIDEGKYKTLKGKEFNDMKKMLESGAKNTIDKLSERKAINIRVFKNDINKLKSIAFREGIPYQTLITSTLHKVANGELKI